MVCVVLSLLGASSGSTGMGSLDPVTPAPGGAMALARESSPLAKTRALLGDSFREYESAHYVVLSGAGKAWTRTQLDRLEDTYAQFQRYAAELKLQPDPLRHKLVGVLFEDRRAYAEFGRSHDGVHAQWNHGYYSPAGDRIVLFNGEAEADADEFAPVRTIATTVHEAIHQLHYHTNVQNKHVQYPLWSCEGIATCFETSRTTEPFGPEREFSPRRSRFERLLRQDKLISLRRLVQFDQMPDQERQTVFTVYNESYALVSWLALNRPDQLRSYLRRMKSAEPGRAEPKTHLAIFIASFGEPEALEEDWLGDEIRRVGSETVSAELLQRLHASSEMIQEAKAYRELHGDMTALENDDEESDWLDDIDYSRAADGMHDLSGLSGTTTPSR